MSKQKTFVETPSHTDTSIITASDAALRYIAAMHGAEVPLEPFSAAVTAQALASALHPYKTPHGREADSKMVMAISITQQQAEPVAQKPVATVRVTHKGYGMELSTYVAYALPEGVHDLYATAQLVASEAMEPPDPAVAAIQFALETDNGMHFLRLWNEGEFDLLRDTWPEAPDAIYIGADPLFIVAQKGGAE